jgi:Na+-transporting NADH:ubiquinone oxidoreductase subunit NqrB
MGQSQSQSHCSGTHYLYWYIIWKHLSFLLILFGRIILEINLIEFIIAAAGMAYFIVADKTVLASARKNSFSASNRPT